MAVLQKIRERGTLLIIVIGGALAAFILTEFIKDPGGLQSRGDGSIGSIYGEDINQEEFSETLSFIKNTQQSQNLPEGQKNSFAWDKLIKDKIINFSSKNIGLNVCGKELYELETGNISPNNVSPYFSSFFINPDTRKFDNELVNSWLENFDNLDNERRSIFLNLENQAIQIRYEQKYQSLIEKGMYTTTDEASRVLNEKSQNANVSYVSIPFSSIEDIEVTEDEINDFYIKNIEDFQNDKETRNIEYVTFTVIPSSEDDKNVREELTKLSAKFNDSDNDELFASRYTSELIESFPYLKKEQVTDPKFSELIEMDLGSVLGPYKLTNGRYRLSKFSELVKRPDSVEARHILLNSENYSRDTAEVILKDLRNQVKSGIDFGELAMKYSDDNGSKIKGGELGWFEEGKMVPQFEDACFSSKKGDLKIVPTQYGVHLIQVTGVSKLINKYKIVHLDKDVLASPETKDFYYDQANDFITGANNKPRDTSFSSYAQSQNQLIREDVNVDKMKYNVSALENSRDIVKWLFDANLGDVSNTIYTCGDNYVVASLSGINYEGDLDLEFVKDQIIQKIQKEKKYEYIQKKISDDSSLENISKIFSTEIKTTEGVNFNNNNVNEVGNSPNFVGVVNSIDVNTVSPLIKGTNAVYVLSVNNKAEPVKNNATPNQRLEIQKSNFSGIFYNSVMNVLRENANIVDERFNFY